jgi:hypothetical protein
MNNRYYNNYTTALASFRPSESEVDEFGYYIQPEFIPGTDEFDMD